MTPRRFAIAAALAAALPALLTGCKNSLIDRSLIFSTHTTFGLEVGVNPADTTGPAKIIVGYRRAEGVLNPVYYNHDAAKKSGRSGANDSGTLDKFYRPKAYSVIAKFEGKARGGGGGAEGSFALSQWFATGKAADILAQFGGASALTDNPGVARAAASQRLSLSDLDKANPLAWAVIIQKIYDGIVEISNDEDASSADQKSLADKLLKELDQSKFAVKWSGVNAPKYGYNVGENNSGTLNMNRAAPDASKKPFQNALDAMNNYRTSRDKLRQAAGDSQFTIVVTGDDGHLVRTGNPQIFSVNMAKGVAQTLDAVFKTIQKDLETDPALKKLLSTLAGDSN